jgi:hypothetical protein
MAEKDVPVNSIIPGVVVGKIHVIAAAPGRSVRLCSVNLILRCSRINSLGKIVSVSLIERVHIMTGSDHSESTFNWYLLSDFYSSNPILGLAGTSYVSLTHELVEMTRKNVHKNLPRSKQEQG